MRLGARELLQHEPTEPEGLRSKNQLWMERAGLLGSLTSVKTIDTRVDAKRKRMPMGADAHGDAYGPAVFERGESVLLERRGVGRGRRRKR